MSIICKTCSKDLFKSDGSGPFVCPSCVSKSIEAVDSQTGELVQLQINGKPAKIGKSSHAIMAHLIRETRFTAPLPTRQETPIMLKLQSKQFRSTHETLNGVDCKFDKSGVALVAVHNKQFIDKWMDSVPNRVFWVEEPVLQPVEEIIETLSPSKEELPEVKRPVGRPKFKKG